MLVAGLGQSSLDSLAVVEVYPSVDTKQEVIEWQEQCGGPTATALVTLSRLGVPCRFLGVIGEDYAGEKIMQSLEKEHIDISGIVKRGNAVSQSAFIAIEKATAKRTIFWRRPSGEALKRTEIGDDFLKGADLLLLDGLMQEASIYAAEQAKEQNIPVMLDAGRKRPGMIDIAKLSDYVVASGEFAKDYGWDLSQEGLTRQKEKLGPKVLSVTLGEQGSVTVSDSIFFHVPAFNIKAIDTTGAGDVFHGAYIYGLLHGWPLKDTLIFASAVSAIKCTQIGGRAGIPTLAEVKAFLSERGHSMPQY